MHSREAVLITKKSSVANAPRGAGNEPKRECADGPKKPEVLQAKHPSQPTRRVEAHRWFDVGRLKQPGNKRHNQHSWLKNSDEETRHRQMMAALDGPIGIQPRDELEAMMAAQLIASHSAAMECYRRALIPEQTFEGRHEALNQANKLSRSFAVFLEALNRHRGKGQQKVTVEHVHVLSGGQAIVGAVGPGGGIASKDEEQAHAKPIAHAPEPPLRSEDTTREPVPVSGNGERTLPNARRTVGAAHRPHDLGTLNQPAKFLPPA
jgi:hypothetical protein